MPDAAVIPFQPGRRRTTTRTTKRNPAPTRRGISLAEAWEAWEIALNNRGRSTGTITSYRDTIEAFAGWLTRHELPDDVEQVTAEHVRLFLIDVREKTSAGNAHKHFRNLRACFRWLLKEGDRTPPSPVDADDAPHVTEKELPPFTDDEIRALLATCTGGSFADLRDAAIMRLLIDIGPRAQGVADIRHCPGDPEATDLKLAQYRIRIRLKGGDEYWAPIGKKTAEAISRYIRRARSRHPQADQEWLWLGKAGRLNKSGVQQMLRRRGREAGVENVHAHRFRRTSATLYLDAGGSETGAMYNYGWKRPEMVRHYTKATARERARREHGEVSPGDRF